MTRALILRGPSDMSMDIHFASEIDDDVRFDEHELTDGAAPADDAEDSDAVIGLREWGTSRTFPLRAPVIQSLRGSATPRALLKVSQDLVRASTETELVYEGHAWRVKDPAGIGGLQQDGIPVRELTLAAGAEITVSGRTLIAESVRLIALRNFCCRLLGWGDESAAVVDQALRAIRLACSGRAPLVLQGGGDLVPIAHAIHQRVLGPGRPFVVSDRRRGDTPATVRSPDNCADAMEALRKASGGSLCVRARRLPTNFDQVLDAFRAPGSGVQLVICADSARGAFAIGAAPVKIPPLECRRADLPRIVAEYEEDVAEWLRTPDLRLEPRDIAWLLQPPRLTLPDIEKSILRLMALKVSRNVSATAARLGMAPVSLTRWLRRRGR